MSDKRDDAPMADDSSFVQSLSRGLAIIRAFGPEHQQMSLADVARATSLTRATVRRFLLTLEHLGYVRSTERVFSLTPKVLELGFSYLSSMSFTDVAKPHLEALSRAVGESTSAALLDGPDIVYVARVPAKRIVSLSIDIGTRLPAYATAMGRVLLAALPEEELDGVLDRSSIRQLTPRTVTDKLALRTEIDRVREQGWAIVDQEAMEIGLLSVAAPVWRSGQVIAAINVSTSARQDSPTLAVARFRDLLLITAGLLSKDLEHLSS